jgi:DNA sulfur modification protein DndB
LSSIYQGTKALLGKRGLDAVASEETLLATEFWNQVSLHIPEWRLAAAKKAVPSELRREFVHSHGIALHSLGMMGAALLKHHGKSWKDRLTALESIDWSRKNTTLWEGRALSGGRISKATANVQLTSAFLKATLSLPLSKEETRLEEGLRRVGK